MQKVILNKCYGGYGWSNDAVAEYLKRKSPKSDIVKGNNGVFLNGCFFYDGNITRVDPVAIELLEEKGSDFCSGQFSELAIEEYDDQYFDFEIDEYDGIESLRLIPKLSEEQIRSCDSIDEIIELLRKCDVIG